MSAADFCKHGVPTACYCRWCREGGEPTDPVALSDEERATRRAAIESVRAAYLASVPKRTARRGRGAR